MGGTTYLVSKHTELLLVELLLVGAKAKEMDRSLIKNLQMFLKQKQQVNISPHVQTFLCDNGILTNESNSIFACFNTHFL